VALLDLSLVLTAQPGRLLYRLVALMLTSDQLAAPSKVLGLRGGDGTLGESATIGVKAGSRYR
jgi:hypothetical protein